MKEKFILEVVNEELIIRNKKKTTLCEELKKRGYRRFKDFTQIKTTKKHKVKSKKEGENVEGEDQDEEEVEQKDSVTDYNYLLGMPLWNLTFEKVQ